MTGVPTRADVERLFDADANRWPAWSYRPWWVLIWSWREGCWRLVYDPPSPPRVEVP